MPTAVDSTTAAAPSPASGAVPRVATTAESASRKSGSATSAPSAGIASRAISRSRPGAGGRASGTPRPYGPCRPTRETAPTGLPGFLRTHPVHGIRAGQRLGPAPVVGQPSTRCPQGVNTAPAPSPQLRPQAAHRACLALSDPGGRHTPVTVAEFPLSGMSPPDEPGGLDRGSDRNPDRTPPQDLAAEQGVLGGMLLSKDAIADVVEVVRGADFYKPAHQTIYDTILDLYGRGEPADALTVAADLTRQGEIARIGGPAYLHTLISMVPTAANAGYYAEIVRERAILRRLVEAGTRIVQLGYSADGAEVDAVVDRAQAEVYAVTERRTSEDYIALGDVMPGTLDEIEAISNRSGELVGVPTGFGDLDGLLHGLHPGQMIVVAAQAGHGQVPGRRHSDHRGSHR